MHAAQEEGRTKASYLISCSHSGPWGGASTSLQSCGLTRFGGPVGWLRGLLVIDFAIATAPEALISTQVESSTEDRHATGELERLPAPLFGVLPDLPVARNGAHEAHPFTSGLAINSARRSGRSVGSGQKTRLPPTDRFRGSLRMTSRIRRNEFARQLGSCSGLTIRAPARKSRKKRSSRDTSMSAANS